MHIGERSFRCFVEQELGRFPLFVIYAVLEWLLIIVLFVDGLLAFAANEFAKFFEMRIPCLLCTRIDHVLVRRSPDFYYNNSICESHKKDLSSLAYCHVHKKLSDIKEMCEGCLLSFATEKDSDCNTYKSLVGILHKDLDCFVRDDSRVHFTLPSSLKKDDDEQLENKSSDQSCSCCGEPLKAFSHFDGSVRKSLRRANPITQAPTPSPRGPLTVRGEEPNLMLPHIRYMELKESDVFDDASSNPIMPDTQGTEDLKAASVPLLTDSEDITDALKTPTFTRGNRFFGIPLTDSANSSPRWAGRMLRKSPLEKVDFTSESIEGNATVDADSNSMVSHLKRQVKLDRKSLIALYMELDEERSASAVAANNAMAMITRLQAEKAAVQMEALQYQRMMEEQAEYDQEALQETNNMLLKREQEIKALQAELDAYRVKYGYLEEDGFQASRDETDDDFQEMKTRTNSFSNAGSECGSNSRNSEGEDDLISLRAEIMDADLCNHAASGIVEMPEKGPTVFQQSFSTHS